MKTEVPPALKPLANTFFSGLFAHWFWDWPRELPLLAMDGTEWQVPLNKSLLSPPLTRTSRGVVTVLKQVRHGCCRPWDADRVECPVFQADQAVEERRAGCSPALPAPSLSLPPSLALSVMDRAPC